MMIPQKKDRSMATYRSSRVHGGVVKQPVASSTKQIQRLKTALRKVKDLPEEKTAKRA